MKKIIIFLIYIFLITGCVLVSETPPNSPTPLYPTHTEISNTLPPTAVIETTETPYDQAIPTSTLIPTSTVVHTSSATPTSKPTFTRTPQLTDTPFPIEFQSGIPVYIKNFSHPSEGCNWMGVAGQVFDINGNPLLNSVILIHGTINGTVIENVGVTGVPEADIYGPGGYEMQISNQVFDSNDLLSIQVFDLNGDPTSEVIPFQTFDDCEKNLIIINFQNKD